MRIRVEILFFLRSSVYFLFLVKCADCTIHMNVHMCVYGCTCTCVYMYVHVHVHCRLWWRVSVGFLQLKTGQERLLRLRHYLVDC